MTGILAMTSTGLRDPGGLGELNDPINETLSSTTAPKKSQTNMPWTAVVLLLSPDGPSITMRPGRGAHRSISFNAFWER